MYNFRKIWLPFIAFIRIRFKKIMRAGSCCSTAKDLAMNAQRNIIIMLVILILPHDTGFQPTSFGCELWGNLTMLAVPFAYFAKQRAEKNDGERKSSLVLLLSLSNNVLTVCLCCPLLVYMVTCGKNSSNKIIWIRMRHVCAAMKYNIFVFSASWPSYFRYIVLHTSFWDFAITWGAYVVCF